MTTQKGFGIIVIFVVLRQKKDRRHNDAVHGEVKGLGPVAKQGNLCTAIQYEGVQEDSNDFVDGHGGQKMTP